MAASATCGPHLQLLRWQRPGVGRQQAAKCQRGCGLGARQLVALQPDLRSRVRVLMYVNHEAHMWCSRLGGLHASQAPS
jgi:hypothetical protein